MVVGYAGDGELGRRVLLVALALMITATLLLGLSKTWVFAGASDLSTGARPPRAVAAMSGNAPGLGEVTGQGLEPDFERRQLEPETA